jgi:hypothetical protein
MLPVALSFVTLALVEVASHEGSLITETSSRKTNVPTAVVAWPQRLCPLIENLWAGLKEKILIRDKRRQIVGRRVGVTAMVETGGEITPDI